MDAIHDLGGMCGFGAIEVEEDEPTFHEPWEALAFGLNAISIVSIGAYNVDEYRHAVGRMDPAHYLAASYYERVLTAVSTLLCGGNGDGNGDVEGDSGDLGRERGSKNHSITRQTGPA